MGKINVSRVILGGLVAGVVLNVFDFLNFGMIFKNDYDNAMRALNKPIVSGNTIMWFVALDFLFGIFLIWLYAAIRPRFGPGPKTAAIAGFAYWVLFGLLHALSEAPLGLFPQSLFISGAVIMLVQAVLASVVGAKLYAESA
jgi:hypothetical protein